MQDFTLINNKESLVDTLPDTIYTKHLVYPLLPLW